MSDGGRKNTGFKEFIAGGTQKSHEGNLFGKRGEGHGATATIRKQQWKGKGGRGVKAYEIFYRQLGRGGSAKKEIRFLGKKNPRRRENPTRKGKKRGGGDFRKTILGNKRSVSQDLIRGRGEKSLAGLVNTP